VRVEKENLCLYGHPNGGWEVSLPVEEVLSEMPEPALKINFARDGMKRRDWLSLIAVYSDAWVISVAFFFAAKLNANNSFSRTELVEMDYSLVLSPKVHHWLSGRSSARSLLCMRI